ncbi:class I SAM-dependent methyltransferase [Streptomyces morookaense]|uniref:Class I SAM-dependent methyltransferase n=1 Tax=Streptomyces morookaense TaxID=1970 RepID=A0A7Y7E881_STRMO|nr:class I SAM-dependent methyltransferase [Streptomyces morookaense]NVK79169.1 class I SAM-dependent methyltransferase [Streptomyces morookaense]GHF28023.1 S-adenosylmethionine-dependent methyltransferase [Streptomyces morookaense]
MLARKELPPEFVEWNKQWGAPYGHRSARLIEEGKRPVQRPAQAVADPANPDYGPFAFQHASGTRVHEYPWMFAAAGLEPGMRVLDVGGGLSGQQFVAAKAGCEVVNVDPSARDDYNVWTDPGYLPLSPELHQRINDTFDTDVRLIAERIQDADLEPESFDRVLCLSVLEHLDPAEAKEVIEVCARLLRPGGLMVLTVDLFLDLKPFGVLEENMWGINQDVGAAIADSGLVLETGDPRELLGFPEFDLDHVVASLPEILIAPLYPVMSQSLTLRKPQT